jgi:ABC-type antimicrobial peptide transport system permease subunit
MVIGHGLRLAFAGLAIGAVVALVLTQVLSSFSNLIYESKSTDPVTFIVISLILMGVALLAYYIPARRATELDPMVALKCE